MHERFAAGKAVLLDALFQTICDREPLGDGMTRVVYAMPAIPNVVVKFELGGGEHFQNVEEWETWQHVKMVDSIAKWLAPCDYISSDGRVLLQRKTVPPKDNQYPTHLPVWLTDTKRENFGMLGKHFVCHDYGTNLLRENGMTKRVRKINWR